MALRLSIGASRPRLVRQLITESLLIAVAGGMLGLGIGYAGMLLFRQIEIPSDLPIALGFQMDRRALLFSLAVAVASALIFGIYLLSYGITLLVSAAQAKSRPNLRANLHGSSAAA